MEFADREIEDMVSIPEVCTLEKVSSLDYVDWTKFTLYILHLVTTTIARDELPYFFGEAPLVKACQILPHLI